MDSHILASRASGPVLAIGRGLAQSERASGLCAGEARAYCLGLQGRLEVSVRRLFCRQPLNVSIGIQQDAAPYAAFLDRDSEAHLRP